MEHICHPKAVLSGHFKIFYNASICYIVGGLCSFKIVFSCCDLVYSLIGPHASRNLYGLRSRWFKRTVSIFVSTRLFFRGHHERNSLQSDTTHN